MSIHVFAETVCAHCIIVRSGPSAREMWNDYGWTCIGVKHEENKTIEFKALVAPKWPWPLRWLFMPLTPLHVLAAFRLAESMGYTPYFERAKTRNWNKISARAD